MAHICIYASPSYSKPIAILSPIEATLRRIAKAVDADESSTLHQMCENHQVRAAVCKELQTVGKESGLQGIEIVQNVVIAEQDWTPQSKLVTDTQKVNRRTVAEVFAKQIEAAYKSLDI